MDFRDYLRLSIDADAKRLKHYRKLGASRVIGSLKCRHDKKCGRDKYYLKQGDKEKYVRTSSNVTVWALQMKRFGAAMARVVEHNIKIKKQLIDELWSEDPKEIIQELPKAYRPNNLFQPKAASRRIRQSENPYKREELKLCTSFGLWVRTKGELLIAELLYSLGIEFYYEKALHLRVQRERERRNSDGAIRREMVWVTVTYYPDFTIILPDGSEVFWEHKGMLNKPEYVERDIQKEVDYNINRIFQPFNYMVTTEGPKNEMDMEGIRRIVDGWLMPLLAA